MQVKYIYLHGFASGPQSSKAQYFRRRFAERSVKLHLPRLDQGNFEGLTITSQLDVIHQAVAGEPAVLIGSSLGGYLAALYAARHPEIERLVLLAPALQFPRRWRERYSTAELEEWKREGSVPIFHYAYAEERPLGYQLMEDSLTFEDEPEFIQPALLLHGTLDPVVPASLSQSYAARHPNVTLKLFESGHELTDALDALWEEIGMFLAFQGS
jgi:pimeloyl-ACP methyl ester carboxylesterase